VISNRGTSGFQDKIKLFDFGLAKELKDEFKVGPDQYHATEMTGTRRYMAPEVFSEAGLYGLPADVYSFVLILWEVTSLKISFGRMVAYDAVSPYITKKRPNIKRRWPGEVKRLIKDGLHADPSRRPNMPMIQFAMKYHRISSRTGGNHATWTIYELANNNCRSTSMIQRRHICLRLDSLTIRAQFIASAELRLE